MQEGARKDVERAFGVLQKRFAIVRNPARLSKHRDVITVMRGCIILHNMIIEDERAEPVEDLEEEHLPLLSIDRNPVTLGEYSRRWEEIKDRSAHLQLRRDLIEHL
ncbi:predicted protein [Lichtheimia corymbifera JMRC:FSU:9682]|uniref:DDE Tnp4 domain-containing protein n=1 Tax=Lichtheimia corymbifera JMRC:FSU:9682 TaxID=1263082 RepID=A0A068SHT5_9FUNG|nr:predicted protein [Lichtheimia corymbifera JMRC:FSU:9682]